MPASPTPRGLPRRDLLRLAGVVVTGAALAACTTSPGPGPGPTASPGAPDDPDLTLRSEVAGDEAALSDLYAELAPAFPAALRTKVAAVGARHADYRAAVIAGATVSATSTGSPTATSSASPSAALSRLRAAERNAAAARAAQSVRAQSPELARTIVLAGTGAASAAEYLRSLG